MEILVQHWLQTFPSKNKDSLVRMLENKILPLGMGRIGIRCRTHTEMLNNVSFDDVIEVEQKWIERSGYEF